MNQYYLRIEGVNLSNFVYDTQDLSTIRGGGLLLLNAIETVKSHLSKQSFCSQMEEISTGASSGLFEIESDELKDDIEKEVRSFLLSDRRLKHATFVVDLLPFEKTDIEKNEQLDNNFQLNKEKVIALNRWQQMQSPSVIFSSDESLNVCDVDLVRSATCKDYGPDNKERKVSKSVYKRREYGKNQKQEFYENQIGKNVLLEEVDKVGFVNDLEKLSANESKGNLNHKIAIIYLDGNHFGAIQNNYCTTLKSQLEFDTKIKKYRRELLAELFSQKINKDKKDWLFSNTEDCKYRIETLLWGGDEIIWVVPAWKGWETLDFFYRHSQNWEFEGNALTHAAGLVFCHHNAPIHRITKLAKDLAELAKDRGKELVKNLPEKEKQTTRLENLFAYQILESFDHTGVDLEKFRRESLPETIETEKLILSADPINTFPKTALQSLGREFPKRRLYKLVQDIRDKDKESDIKYSKDKLEKDTQNHIDEVANYLNLSSDSPIFWLHLADLWDYLIASNKAEVSS